MKRIVIIGASSGLGRLVAEDFARRGWMVGIAARREELLRQLADSYPGQMCRKAIDVGSADAADRLRELIGELGGMDVLFYASGVGFANPQLDPALDERIIRVNVEGFTRVVNAAYLWFKEHGATGGGKPRIAAITSVAGTKGLGVAGAYSASKSYGQTYLQAIDQLAHIQHMPLGVTDIRPGFIRTDLLDPNRKYPMIMKAPYAARRITRAILRGRRVCTVDWRWRIVVALWRLIPGWLWRLLPVSNL